MLASFGEADYTASSASAMLARSPLLTDPEQTIYGDLIQRQERDHGLVAMEWSRKYGWDSSRLPSALPALGQRDCLMFAHIGDLRLRTALLLATLRAVEKAAVRGFQGWVRTTHAHGLTEMARDFDLILADERMHVEENERVTRRLAEKDPAFHRMEAQAYLLTRRVYAPVIHDAIRLVE